MGGFDTATSYNGAFKEPDVFNAKVHLLWLGAGTGEERFATAMRAMHTKLDAAGIKNIVFESQGTAHEWQTCAGRYTTLRDGCSATSFGLTQQRFLLRDHWALLTLRGRGQQG